MDLKNIREAWSLVGLLGKVFLDGKVAQWRTTVWESEQAGGLGFSDGGGARQLWALELGKCEMYLMTYIPSSSSGTRDTCKNVVGNESDSWALRAQEAGRSAKWYNRHGWWPASKMGIPGIRVLMGSPPI